MSLTSPATFSCLLQFGCAANNIAKRFNEGNGKGNNNDEGNCAIELQFFSVAVALGSRMVFMFLGCPWWLLVLDFISLCLVRAFTFISRCSSLPRPNLDLVPCQKNPPLMSLTSPATFSCLLQFAFAAKKIAKRFNEGNDEGNGNDKRNGNGNDKRNGNDKHKDKFDCTRHFFPRGFMFALYAVLAVRQ